MRKSSAWPGSVRTEAGQGLEEILWRMTERPVCLQVLLCSPVSTRGEGPTGGRVGRKRGQVTKGRGQKRGTCV